MSIFYNDLYRRILINSIKMSGNNILVIDDSHTNLVLLESLLQRSGYTVSSALSAKEGLKSIEESVPDLIYLDFLMPEIDGLEFMAILNENDSWRGIPIVMLSAISDKEVIKKSKELGVKEYIVKPINLHRIVSLTKEILSN